MDPIYFFKPVSSANVGGLGPFFYHVKSFKGKEQSSGKKFGVYEVACAIFCLLQDWNRTAQFQKEIMLLSTGEQIPQGAREGH